MDSNGRERALPTPPPLPPRQSSSQSAQHADDPPPYEVVAHQQRALEKATSNMSSGAGEELNHNDPRSSSQQSLLPAYEERDQRRTLLLIYIHGFMGNETSFRSFPAHVHNLLSLLLAETHVVHTKVYPRYRSRGNIRIARNDFSKWLQPHESPTTDIVLLGHSMGGLLAAEIVLMHPPRPASRPFVHRILGTINFDVPFLGMHPGIVKSGLSSIFRPAEETHEDKWDDVQPPPAGMDGSGPAGPARVDSPPSRADTLWSPGSNDPNFNPKFKNDVILPVRKGWSNALHFVNKHSGNLIQSTKQLVSSHLEFGGVMADLGELKARYTRIRTLEEENESVRRSLVNSEVMPRVRFVNYWTASTGRKKKPKPPGHEHSPSPNASRSASVASGPIDTNVEHLPRGDPQKTEQQPELAMESLQIGGPTPSSEASKGAARQSAPTKPPPLGDLSYIMDESIRKAVEAEHERAMEAYENALKEYQKEASGANTVEELQRNDKQDDPDKNEVNARAELVVEKPELEMTHQEKENLRLQKERQRMEAEARRMRGEKEPEHQTPTVVIRRESMQTLEGSAASVMSGNTLETIATNDSTSLKPSKDKEDGPAKPKKDRKFCVLPPKDASGERDPCWVRIFMEGTDEVGAHCGLFFVDERYERLVGDVVERIELWVKEDHSLRIMRSMDQMKS